VAAQTYRAACAVKNGRTYYGKARAKSKKCGRQFVLVRQHPPLSSEQKRRVRLAKNSANSHKPPSSEGYTKKPAFAKISTGKVGGQIGHKGKTLQMSTSPNELIKHYAEICSACSTKLSESDAIK
jgi:hypothetical protein